MSGRSGRESLDADLVVIVILLSDCLQYSNSAMNPVLYAFLSDNFKKSFRKACHCDKREVTGLGHNQDCSATTRYCSPLTGSTQQCFLWISVSSISIHYIYLRVH